MPQQQYIRFLREVEDCSVNEIAGRVGIHWRTAKKYADQTDWNASITKRKSTSPVMGPFMEIVDTWLEEDRLLPRKQRHTGVRIFQFPFVLIPLFWLVTIIAHILLGIHFVRRKKIIHNNQGIAPVSN